MCFSSSHISLELSANSKHNLIQMHLKVFLNTEHHTAKVWERRNSNKAKTVLKTTNIALINKSKRF